MNIFQRASELVAIDPATANIVGNYPMTGIESRHGIAIDVSARLAFVVVGEEITNWQ